MSKKVIVVIIMAAFCLAGICSISCAADEKKPISPLPAQGKIMKKVPAMPSNTSMFGGTIENIDKSDPANIKVSVKNEADGAVHVLSVAPFTNVTKITDVSELKTGDAVRVMVRKSDDNKETALGILFGKIKPRPKPPVVKK